MSRGTERAGGGDIARALILPPALQLFDGAGGEGFYTARHLDQDGRLVWEAHVENVWCLEGMRALLTHGLKGSSYTAACALGLIDGTGYGFAGANGTGVSRGALAGSITAAGGASPANGWNEVPSSVVAARGTPSFGTASASGVNADLACSTINFSTLAARTIKGLFLLIRSEGGTAPTTTVGNTSGALLSCGLFAEGDQTVGVGTLQVTYTARLTTT